MALYIKYFLFFYFLFLSIGRKRKTHAEQNPTAYANQIIVFFYYHSRRPSFYINQRDTLQNDEYSVVLNSIVGRKKNVFNENNKKTFYKSLK